MMELMLTAMVKMILMLMVMDLFLLSMGSYLTSRIRVNSGGDGWDRTNWHNNPVIINLQMFIHLQ